MSTLITEGEAASVGPGVVEGNVRILLPGRMGSLTATQLASLKEGEILVTTMTTPDFEPIMAIAGAILTDIGGATCHAAIISREAKKLCVVAVGHTDHCRATHKPPSGGDVHAVTCLCPVATRTLKTGQRVRVEIDKPSRTGRVFAV